MTDRIGSQAHDDAAAGTAEIVLAQAEQATDAPAGATPSELAPTGPLEPTGPLGATEQATQEATEEATSLPRDLVDVDEVLQPTDEAGEAAQVSPVEAPAAGETPGALDVTGVLEPDAPGAGERLVVEVPPGTMVRLSNESFDPQLATYAVDGDDLVISLANGGVLVLVDFFAAGGEGRQLAVLDAPATPAGELLARAEAAPVVEGEVQPAAGPQPDAGPQTIVGGASNFRAYDQGTIGEGLDPLGPLGPTELGFGAAFDEGGVLGFVGDAGDGPPGPPENEAPQITLRSTIEATIGEQSGPAFNPASTPRLPIDPAALQPDGVDRTGLSYNEWLASRPDYRELTDQEINNVDQRNLTLDIEREVIIRFINEDSYSIDSLFVHEIAADGSIVNVRLVFDGTNLPTDAFSDQKSLEPGTEVSLGTYAAGTQLAFILLNDGYRINDFAELEGGHFEVRDPKTGAIAKITDFHDFSQPDTNPIIVHIAEDGTETVLNGQRYFSADASQDSIDNRLNPTGQPAYVSGWNDVDGFLVIGVEEGIGRFDDNTFTDLVFGVRFGSPLEKVLVIKDQSLEAVITDADSTEMAAATITLAGLAGDSLVLDPAIAAGTDITVTQVSDTEIQLEGISSIENYEKVISAAKISIDLDEALTGTRTISVSVTDPDGLSGSTSTSVVVDDNLLAGTEGGDSPDVFPATSVTTPDSDGRDVISGRAGDDHIKPLSGDDFVDGGDGNDTIDARWPGENTITGGPLNDFIILGPGADTVRMTGLGDGADTIRFFNATEGDKLDLTLLLRDSDITAENFSQFVRTIGSSGGIVQVDLDGGGSDHRWVDVAYLQDATGVTATTDPATFVITPADDPSVV